MRSISSHIIISVLAVTLLSAVIYADFINWDSDFDPILSLKLFQKLLPSEYDDYFILEMIQNSNIGMIVANIIAPLVILTIFYDYVPLKILGVWLTFILILYFIRYRLNAQLMQDIKENSINKTKRMAQILELS